LITGTALFLQSYFSAGSILLQSMNNCL